VNAIDPNQPFFLGNVRVTPASNEIDGVRLECKSMNVLIALAVAAPAVVSAEALLARVWASLVVSDKVVY